MKKEQQLDSQLYYIEISCTTLWHFEQYCQEEIKKMKTWDRNRITYKSSLIVEGLPNCVAVDRSKLKHTIQTRVLFKTSRSCFSVLGIVVGT